MFAASVARKRARLLRRAVALLDSPACRRARARTRELARLARVARRSSAGDHVRAEWNSVLSSSIGGDERAAERRIPAERAVLHRAADALHAGRQARRTSGSLAIVAVPRSARAMRCIASASGPVGATAEQQPVELLDVVAGFEDEKLEKTRRAALMRAPCWLCASTKLGRAASGVHGRAQLAHRVRRVRRIPRD